MLLMLSDKGKYATATESRRFVWTKIVWPLILEVNEISFSINQYQRKRDQICQIEKMKIPNTSRGLVSLIQKGILLKEDNIYSIHYRLIPYMRLRASCNYATAIHEVRVK